MFYGPPITAYTGSPAANTDQLPVWYQMSVTSFMIGRAGIEGSKRQRQCRKPVTPAVDLSMIGKSLHRTTKKATLR